MIYRSGTNTACSSRTRKSGCHGELLCWSPVKRNQLKLHFKYYHLLLSSHYRKETQRSPAGLGGHHHIDSVHADAHDVDDSLSGLRVGQAEDAQGLQAGGTAARHHGTAHQHQEHLQYFLTSHLENYRKVTSSFLHPHSPLLYSPFYFLQGAHIK